MKHKLNFILVIMILFGFISCFTIYKTSFIDSDASNLCYKQFMWYVFGFITIYFVIKLKNKIFLKWSFYLYIVNNFFLFLLLLIGKPINNAKCWFSIPGVGAIQPSEFMKVILILFLCSYLSKYKVVTSIKDEFILLFKTFLIVLIPSILTFLEPDTGNVIIYFIIYLVVMFSYGIKKRWFFLLFTSVFLVISSIGIIYYTNEDLFIKLFGSSFFLRIDRLLDWKSGNGFQLEKSMIAIGYSGLIGNLKIPLYFPESYTDFIFASFASMTGFLGACFLIIVIIIFNILILNISFKCQVTTNKIMINCICCMLIYQQIQNISMTFGLLPITGITLPFISYGGSSLICYMFLIGIILNVDLENKKMLNYKHF